MSLRDYLVESQPDNRPSVPIISSEGIKLVFDVVRNYGLASLVFLGAVEFSRLANSILMNQPPVASVVVAQTIKWSLYGTAAALFFMNALFSTYVFELTPFYKRREEKLRWAISSVVISIALSTLVCVALFLARKNAA